MEIKEHVANIQRARGTYKIPPPIIWETYMWCTCEINDIVPHICQYKAEIEADFALCDCCPYCEENCKLNI